MRFQFNMDGDLVDHSTGEIVTMDAAREELIKASKKTGLAQLDPLGREVVDPVPVAPPVNFKEDLNLFDHLRRLEKINAAGRLEEGEEGDDVADPEDDPQFGDVISEHEDRYRELGRAVSALVEKSTAPLDGLGAREAGDQGVRGAAPAEKPPLASEKPKE